MPYIMFPTGNLEVAVLRRRVRDFHNMDIGSSMPVGFNAREWPQGYLIYQNRLTKGNCCSCSAGILSVVQLQFLKPGMFLQKISASVNQYFLSKLIHQKTSNHFSHLYFLTTVQEEP